MSSRAEATRPVSRPTDIRASGTDVSSWMPPPRTQSAVTTSSTSQPAATLASRHHRGTGPRRRTSRAGATPTAWDVGAKAPKAPVEVSLLVVMSDNVRDASCVLPVPRHRRGP